MSGPEGRNTMENELAIGSVTASFFITFIMGLIYKTFNVSGKWKPWIAIALGIGFSFLYMTYSEIPFTAKQIIDFGLNGLMVGATAVGFHEIAFKKVLPGKK